MKTKTRARLWYFGAFIVVMISVYGGDIQFWQYFTLGIALGMAWYAGALDAVKDKYPRL